MSEWLETNGKYLKAWGSYMLMVFAVSVVIHIIGLPSIVSLPFEALGLAENVRIAIGSAICWIITLVVAFYAFRAAVRKFILNQPD